MQGTYIPQYTPVPPTAVSIEVSLSRTHKVYPIHTKSLLYTQRQGERDLSHASPHNPRNPQIKSLCSSKPYPCKLSIQKSIHWLNQAYILLCTCG